MEDHIQYKDRLEVCLPHRLLSGHRDVVFHDNYSTMYVSTNYYVVRNARLGRSRNTIKLSPIFKKRIN